MKSEKKMSEQLLKSDKFFKALDRCEDIVLNGKVNRVVGLIIESIGPDVLDGGFRHRPHERTVGVSQLATRGDQVDPPILLEYLEDPDAVRD